MIAILGLLDFIAAPLIAGVLALITPKRFKWVKEGLLLLAAAYNLILAVAFFGKEISINWAWAGAGIDFSLRYYHFSSFIILAAAVFAVLVGLYSTVFMSGKDNSRIFYGFFLLSMALVNGAVLANNLILMLFFWEGLLVTLFGMIAIGNKNAFKTATKAVIIVGVSDLCLMFGIGLTYFLTGTLNMSTIAIPATGLGGLAFIFLAIGAISKAGSIPFHSWIPDAAIDAPLPFMAILPASLEKLLGIYFLARITLDLYKLPESSWLSPLLMSVGAFTIIAAVMMALIQKDYKRLLSYHAISQVGYMMLGIGTCLPIGIVGGLFHMINHAFYKSCLFLTGGAVERQAGTTNLEKLGGLGLKMPITFFAFIVAAASISGVPPFNGFFSKELIYDAALERHLVFYIAAALGSFLTAASFLKLGHAAYLGKLNPDNQKVTEAPWPMLVPMVVIALICIFFGVYNAFPLNNFIQPILAVSHLGPLEPIGMVNFSGWPTNNTIVIITCLVILAALLNHWYGVRKGGSAAKASDHIHYAPGLITVYNHAEKRHLDPYNIGLFASNWLAKGAWLVDRAIDWVYEGLSVIVATFTSKIIRAAHTGSYTFYVAWALIGSSLIVFYLVR